MKKKTKTNNPIRRIFVTIGIPHNNIPIANKVMMFVDRTKQKTMNVALDFRAFVAKNHVVYSGLTGVNVCPEDLYYEIYFSPNRLIPAISSPNGPYFKEEKV